MHTPQLGFIVALICSTLAYVSEVAVHLLHVHIPPIVMELTQIFCWLAGGSAGVFSCYHWIKKIKAKSK